MKRYSSPLVLVVASVLLLGVGCSGEGEADDAPPPLNVAMGGMGGGHTIIQLGSCNGDETQERECTIYIEQASGVTSCFTGFQYCSDGTWTDCLDPDRDPRVQ